MPHVSNYGIAMLLKKVPGVLIGNTFYKTPVLVPNVTCFANLTLHLSTTRFFDSGLGTASANTQVVTISTILLSLASKSLTAPLETSSMHLRILLSIA
jgi:hypothetical protein